MDLFESHRGPLNNLLPYDGVVHDYGAVIEGGTADRYFDELMKEIAWVHDEARIFGRRIVTKRKVAWYAERPFTYTYSKVTKTALLWLPLLIELKAIAEQVSGETFNSCLLNLYHDGQEGMAWHSDGEKDLLKDGAIASMSFGAERKFLLKHKDSKEKVSVQLKHGSLLIMKGSTQSHWLHRLPPTKRVHGPRVNLTFRQIFVG
ncbi:MAG: alpha-ketoglutarate-dependent dioxygenase AlkB [Planctomycetota bacterium]|nr:alpha-ketoglutarate-dependent dioxygenase AlkB [Planctomycetota bacterium]